MGLLDLLRGCSAQEVPVARDGRAVLRRGAGCRVLRTAGVALLVALLMVLGRVTLLVLLPLRRLPTEQLVEESHRHSFSGAVAVGSSPYRSNDPQRDRFPVNAQANIREPTTTRTHARRRCRARGPASGPPAARSHPDRPPRTSSPRLPGSSPRRASPRPDRRRRRRS